MASMAATTWRPAFSMSTSDGSPTSSIVRRSASRICAAVSTRIGLHVTLRCVSATVNVNGRVLDQAHAVISVFDHGFLYGEGVYETLRTFNGRPFLFDRHMQRLRNSARMLMLDVPVTDAEMADRCRETMKAAGLGEREGAGRADEAYIRILLTRGVGELSYDPAGCPEPSIVIIVKPQIDPPASAYEHGMK